MYNLIPFARRGNQLSSLFDELERGFFSGESRPMPTFRTDIQDQGDHFLLEAELPGFAKEDINLELHDGVLIISAKGEEQVEQQQGRGYICRERRYGSVERRFDVSGIQEDAIAASYENGVLKLTLPKVGEPEPQRRTITIG